jgi:hypothetical protein
MGYEARGKLSLIISVLIGLLFISIIALYGIYWAALNKNPRVNADGRGNETISIADTGKIIPKISGTTNSESGVKRLRSLLLTRLPEGETERFRRVFDSLEIAEAEGRIDKSRFDLIPEILKMVLRDGQIDYNEHELLLDNLEATILPKKGR